MAITVGHIPYLTDSAKSMKLRCVAVYNIHSKVVTLFPVFSQKRSLRNGPITGFSCPFRRHNHVMFLIVHGTCHLAETMHLNTAFAGYLIVYTCAWVILPLLFTNITTDDFHIYLIYKKPSISSNLLHFIKRNWNLQKILLILKFAHLRGYV